MNRANAVKIGIAEADSMTTACGISFACSKQTDAPCARYTGPETRSWAREPSLRREDGVPMPSESPRSRRVRPIVTKTFPKMTRMKDELLSGGAMAMLLASCHFLSTGLYLLARNRAILDVIAN